MHDKSLLIAREDALRVIVVERPNLSYQQAVKIANSIIAGIDWDNTGLMHKGIEWITERYLKKNVPVGA